MRPTRAYICDYCNKTSISIRKIKKHEDRCPKNPQFIKRKELFKEIERTYK